MIEVTDIKGVGPSKAETLEENGYESVEDIAQADPDNLSDVSGISEDRALEFMVSAGDLLDAEDDAADEASAESEGDEFDLTPEEVSEELEDEEEEPESEPEIEAVDEDEEDEDPVDATDEVQAESEDPTFEVSVDFESDLQYHTFHAAIMRYHENIYTSNQPHSDAMQKILDGLVGAEDVSYELTEEELNTLHTAVKQCRTDYQGNNLIDHMDALNPVEDQINDQRRDYLF